MSTGEILVDRQWRVGGFDPHLVERMEKDTWRGRPLAVPLQEQVGAIINEIDQEGQTHLTSGRAKFACRLVTEEAMVNMVGHGNGCDATLESDVHFRIERMTDGTKAVLRMTLSLQDYQPPFEIDRLPDPTDPDNLERTTGRGIMLARALVHAEIRQIPHDLGKTVVYEWFDPPREPVESKEAIQ